MKIQKIILVLVFVTYLISVCFSAKAQTLVAQNFSKRDGLPEEHTDFLFKDSRGFLWIATADGLFRYDGYHFKAYRKIPGKKNCLINNTVKCLSEDEKGNLWIGTIDGISVFTPQGETFVNYSSIASDSGTRTFPAINNIFSDNEHRMWLGTFAGLFLFDKRSRQFHQYHFKSNKSSNRADVIGAIEEDDHGFFWITSGEGLIHFNPNDGNYKIYLFKPDHKKNFKFNNQFMREQINPYNHDEIWIGTWGAGLLCLNLQSKTWRQYLYESSGSTPNLSNIVFHLRFSDSTHIYFTTAQKFAQFDLSTSGFFIFPQDESRPNTLPGSCRYFFEDDRNTYWICNGNGFSKAIINEGLEFLDFGKYHPSAFYNSPHSDTLFFVTVYNHRSFGVLNQKSQAVRLIPLSLLDKNFGETNGLLRDKHGLFWLVTTKGIYSYDLKKNLLTLLLPDSIGIHESTAIAYSDVAADFSGNIYFASYDHPLIQKKISGSFSLLKDSLAEEERDYPFTVVRDQRGNMWMVSKKNVEEYDPVSGRFRYFSDSFFHFFADPSSCFEGIAVDRRHQIWLASSEGLIRLDLRETNKDSAIKRFLSGESVQSVVADDSGFIWVQTFGGYYRIHPMKYYCVPIGDDYGIAEPSFEAGMAALTDGTIELNTNDGAMLIQPARIRYEHRIVPLLFQNFKIFDHELSPDSDLNSVREIKLHHDQNFFALEFNALDLYDPSKLHYKYRLNGVDRDWVNGNKFFASYSQLKPGRYNFEVKASSNDGTVTSNVKSLSIVIIPAFYQMTWFWLLVALTLIALIVWFAIFIFTQKLKQKLAEAEKQKEIDAVRNRVSRDMHDEVGAMLTRISMMSDSGLLENDAAAKTSLKKIRSLAHLSARGLSEVIWSVNPKQDHLENMLSYFRQYIQDFLDDTQFTYKIDFPEEPDTRNVNPELRRNLFLVLKESLNNAVKYSRAKLICVEFKLEEEKFSMKISDDGTGFNTANSKTGNGLSNMKSRMEAVRCSWNIHSENGRGTEVKIEGTIF